MFRRILHTWVLAATEAVGVPHRSREILGRSHPQVEEGAAVGSQLATSLRMATTGALVPQNGLFLSWPEWVEWLLLRTGVVERRRSPSTLRAVVVLEVVRRMVLSQAWAARAVTREVEVEVDQPHSTARSPEPGARVQAGSSS
jgi:hypothetical protein